MERGRDRAQDTHDDRTEAATEGTQGASAARRVARCAKTQLFTRPIRLPPTESPKKRNGIGCVPNICSNCDRNRSCWKLATNSSAFIIQSLTRRVENVSTSTSNVSRLYERM